MKQLSKLLMMLIGILAITGCGKSDSSNYSLIDDEIEGSEEYFSLFTMDPAELPGTWILESIYDTESKTKVDINKTFTILPFDIKQAKETDQFEFDYSDLKYYVATYEDIVEEKVKDTINYSDLMLYLIGMKNSGINQSKIYSFATSFSDDSGLMTLSIVSPEYSQSKLTASGLFIITYKDNGSYSAKTYNGEVTLKKIK